MLIAAALLGLLLAQQLPAPPVNCTSGAPGIADICLADREFAQAETARAMAERTRHLQAALALYRKGASAANATHLNDPAALELTLRDLIGLAPNNLQFMFRLAQVQEDQGELDSAEDTLLAARRQQPQELAPYSMLAQFYARRATALSNQIARAKPQTDIPGAPDKGGIYRIGPGMVPPQRADTPLHPEEAKAAGVSGEVGIEVVVNEQGVVSDEGDPISATAR